MRPFLEKRREEKRREEKVPVLVCTPYRLEGDLLGVALADSGEFSVSAICLTPRAALQHVRSCYSDRQIVVVLFEHFGPPEPQLLAGALAHESKAVSSVLVYRDGSECCGHQVVDNPLAGLCSANAGLTELLRVLREVAAGQISFCPITARRWCVESGNGRLSEKDQAGTQSRLTPAERNILRYAASTTVEETAGLLGISPRTVSTHRTRIRRKLGKASWRDLARREGLLPPDTGQKRPTIWLEKTTQRNHDDSFSVEPWTTIPFTPFGGGNHEPE